MTPDIIPHKYNPFLKSDLNRGFKYKAYPTTKCSINTRYSSLCTVLLLP